MDKNEREKKLLYELAMENGGQYHFQQIDKMKESYFIQRQEDTYIREYAFETLPELMNELNALWNQDGIMEQVKRVIGVAAMKNKPVKTVKDKSEMESREDKEEKLPVYIYNF